MRTALERIAIELEKQNAIKIYEIESKRDEEKAYKELKDKLNKIDEQFNEGYITSDAHIIADEIENGADKIKGEMLFAVSKLQDLSMDLSEINEIMNRQWNAEYGDRVKQKEKREKHEKDKSTNEYSEVEDEHVYNNSIYYYYIETMKDGFEEGKRGDGIYKLACSVLGLAQERIITLSSALFIVETTAKNCKPPFEDWETKWNSAMEYTNNKIK